jgi:4-amino-4-deoxy-L-arabinose transferase-like glycosyltransferase
MLLLGAALLPLAAWLRGPEYDEGYTAFVTSANPRPIWPTTPFEVAATRAAFHPAASPWRIAENLRRTDVHPPLYFWTVWAWRRVFGSNLFTTRLLSVLCSLGALAFLGAIAIRGHYPLLATLLITLGSYGFIETGIIARGFAMAQCLMLAGLFLTLRGGLAESPRIWLLLGAGLALGAASFTNYLAAFTAAAAFAWLLWLWPRRAPWLVAGMLPFLLGDLFFFAAQRNSRIGQFPPFSGSGLIAALAHAAGGALFGGVPLYLPSGLVRAALAVGLGILLGLLLLLPFLVWQRLRRRVPHHLFALAAIAPVLGLGLMGLIAGSVPVEIRYLSFAIPPFALLLAAALDCLPRRLAGGLLGTVLSVQACAIAGLMTRPETMQPEATAARAAWEAVGSEGLVLLPRGNDGVGVVSAFLTASPGTMHVMLVSPGTAPAALTASLCFPPWPRVTMAAIAVDRDSRATLPLLRQLIRVSAKCVDASAAAHLPYPPRS